MPNQHQRGGIQTIQVAKPVLHTQRANLLEKSFVKTIVRAQTQEDVDVMIRGGQVFPNKRKRAVNETPTFSLKLMLTVHMNALPCKFTDAT